MDRATEARERGTTRPRSHLFAVRLWREEAVGAAEYRGSVRDVTSGAFRSFRDWSDLIEFMIAWVEEGGPTQGDHDESGDLGGAIPDR